MVERLGDASALTHVLRAIDTPLDLRAVLYRLVEAVREATNAARCAVFLVDGRTLVPAAVASRRTNQELFKRFRAMEPVDIDASAERSALFTPDDPFGMGGDSTGVVVVDDPSTSEVVPEAWLDTFGTVAIALAPVVGAGEPQALVVIDYTEAHEFTAAELSRLSTGAEIVRIAIGNASLVERAHGLEESRHHLQSAIATSAATADPLEAAEAVLDVVSTAVQRGVSITTVVDGATCTVSTGARDGTVTVFPLGVGAARLGSMEVYGGALDDAALELCSALAQQAALVLDRARLRAEARHRTHVAEIMDRVPHLLDGATTVGHVLERLNREVCRRAGFECVEAAFRSGRVAESTGSRRLDAHESAIVRRATDGTTLEQLDPDGRVAVTIPVNRRPVGLLIARLGSPLAQPSADQRSLLRTIARAVGDLVARTSMHLDLREVERRLEISEAREQLTEHLDQTLGGTLRQLWSRLGELGGELGPGTTRVGAALGELRDLAGRGLLQAHMVAASLALLKMRREGLVVALRALVKSFSDATGIGAVLRVRGEIRELTPEVEEALYLVAFEALSLQEPARSSAVIVTLAFDEGVTLVVRDDGTGLGQRSALAEGTSVHYGIAVTRERLAAVGGELRFAQAQPRGVRLEARIPPDGAPARRGDSERGGVVVRLAARPERPVSSELTY